MPARSKVDQIPAAGSQSIEWYTSRRKTPKRVLPSKAPSRQQNAQSRVKKRKTAVVSVLTEDEDSGAEAERQKVCNYHLPLVGGKGFAFYANPGSTGQ